eukprot:NODE_3355_length_2049_cov_3.341831.p1 GENE.NODE_3355_length_2049_cov_3.341831~~NODE_3355_length_2049_cov_3.341831.p1  ORF type:complete len:384 (+),score=38.88 NODE_3355_length_2049_cov_3.341831:858-2009(+)
MRAPGFKAVAMRRGGLRRASGILGAQHIANTAWSFGGCSREGATRVGDVEAMIVHVALGMPVRSIANTSWAFLSQRMPVVAAPLVPDGWSDCLPDERTRRFGPPYLPILAWSFAAKFLELPAIGAFPSAAAANADGAPWCARALADTPWSLVAPACVDISAEEEFRRFDGRSASAGDATSLAKMAWCGVPSDHARHRTAPHAFLTLPGRVYAFEALQMARSAWLLPRVEVMAELLRGPVAGNTIKCTEARKRRLWRQWHRRARTEGAEGEGDLLPELEEERLALRANDADQGFWEIAGSLTLGWHANATHLYTSRMRRRWCFQTTSRAEGVTQHGFAEKGAPADDVGTELGVVGGMPLMAALATATNDIDVLSVGSSCSGDDL